MRQRDTTDLGPDMEAYWKRISAGGEMKSAIKKLLDSAEHGVGGVGYYSTVRTKYLNEARKAMEAWCNLEPADG